jgi:hypothetical protein
VPPAILERLNLNLVFRIAQSVVQAHTLKWSAQAHAPIVQKATMPLPLGLVTLKSVGLAVQDFILILEPQFAHRVLLASILTNMPLSNAPAVPQENIHQLKEQTLLSFACRVGVGNILVLLPLPVPIVVLAPFLMSSALPLVNAVMMGSTLPVLVRLALEHALPANLENMRFQEALSVPCVSQVFTMVQYQYIKTYLSFRSAQLPH